MTRKGVDMFIIKKKCIYLNDRFRLALFKILTPETYLKGRMWMEKSKGMEKRGAKKTQRGVAVAKSRWLETNYIQSQQTIPLFTEGRLKGLSIQKRT